MRKGVILTATAAAAMAATLLVAGCTSGGSASRGAAAATVGSASAAAPAGLGPLPADKAAGGSAGLPSAGTASAGTGSAGTTTGSAPNSPASSVTLVGDLGDVIRTAEITVGVSTPSDVAVEANKADALVAAQGGAIFGDDRQSGPDASATLTLKVPPAQLVPTLTALAQLGQEQSRTLSSQDVTEQVADVNARVASATASIIRLRSLYDSATKVDDVIAIETELAQRESDLESLQAQQRALSSETEMATVTLVLTTTRPAPVPKPAPRHHTKYAGIGGAFARGWHGFVTAGAWLIAAFGTVLPFAVLIALAAAGVFWVRRRRPAPALPPTADAA